MTAADTKPGSNPAGKMPLSDVQLAEIAVLHGLAVEGGSVVAHLEGGALKFLSRLHFIDPERRYMVVASSEDAAANAALLAVTRVHFRAEVGEWCIEFTAADPEPIVHGGAAAIRLRYPETIASRRRRAFERASVPAEPPLRCIASAEGVLYFEANIFDISLGGIGILQAGPNIALEAGMVLKGCRIECLGREPLRVDLEVRHAGPAALAGGGPAQRAGCRFLNLSPASMDQIELIAKIIGKKL